MSTSASSSRSYSSTTISVLDTEGPTLKSLPWYKNRYLRSFFIYLGVLVTATLYSSWQPMYYMLVKDGAYSWLCTPTSELLPDGSCREQYTVLNQQYQVGSNLAYIVGVVAGFLLDTVGPRWCCLTGVGFVVAGYLMMVFSSESLQLYWPAWVLVGSAENLIGFTGFLPGDFFPGYGQTFITLCISAQILSSFGPPIMWNLMKNGVAFDTVWLTYIFAIAIPLGLLMVFSLPRNNKKRKLEVEYYIYQNQIEISDESSHVEEVKDREYWRDFLRLLMKPELFVFTIWYALMVLSFNYYSSAIIAHSGQAVSEFVGTVGPFRAFVGPLIGLASDKFGMTLVSVGLCAVDAFAYFIALVPTQAAQYTSSVAYLVGRSFVFSTKYLFVQQFYPRVHFGKLSGVMSLMGGLVGFLNTALVAIKAETRTMYTIWGSIVAAAALPIFWIHTRARKAKKAKAQRVSEESEVTAIEEA